MPLYEYRCRDCGGVFEVIQKFSDEPLKIHEACGGPVERLVSAPALQFKGSGWYITDYAKQNGGKTGEAQTGEVKTSEVKTGDAKADGKESKGETKRESKTESKTESASSSPSKTETKAS